MGNLNNDTVAVSAVIVSALAALDGATGRLRTSLAELMEVHGTHRTADAALVMRSLGDTLCAIKRSLVVLRKQAGSEPEPSTGSRSWIALVTHARAIVIAAEGTKLAHALHNSERSTAVLHGQLQCAGDLRRFLRDDLHRLAAGELDATEDFAHVLRAGAARVSWPDVARPCTLIASAIGTNLPIARAVAPGWSVRP